MLLEFAMISPSFDMALLFPKAVQISIPRMPVTSLLAIVGRVGHDCNLVLNLELPKSTNRHGLLL